MLAMFILFGIYYRTGYPDQPVEYAPSRDKIPASLNWMISINFKGIKLQH